MNCLLVRVTTDTGLVGWGECFGFALVSTTRHVLDSLIAPAAVGLPALDIDDTMRTLHKRFHNFGRNGPVTFALSGIDIALWDIRGKHLGRSIYDLLGGAKRDSVSCYASLLPYGNAQLVADNAKRAVEMHYSALKLHEVNVECIEAVHRACPDTPLMLDVNCSFFTQTTAAEFCQTVSDQSRFSDRVLFVEEPLWPPEDFAALSALRSAQPLSVAAGENAGSLAELQSMLHHGAVDIIQPSVIKCGGLSALIQLAAHVKSAHPVRLVPHSPYFGPGLLATLHFLAAADTGMLCSTVWLIIPFAVSLSN
jgi:L-alanine-DL-glutamate epimerase-like enolase superfamily enzyme